MKYGLPLREAFHLLCVLLLCLSCASCLSVTGKLSVAESGSGKFELTATIPSGLLQLKDTRGRDLQLPLFTSERLLRESVAKAPGLVLEFFRSEQQGNDIILTMRGSCTELGQLSRLFPEGVLGVSSRKTASSDELNLTVRPNPAKPAGSVSDMQLWADMAAINRIRIEMTLPRGMRPGGSFSGTGNPAVLDLSVRELLAGGETTTWRITW